MTDDIRDLKPEMPCLLVEPLLDPRAECENKCGRMGKWRVTVLTNETRVTICEVCLLGASKEIWAKVFGQQKEAEW